MGSPFIVYFVQPKSTAFPVKAIQYFEEAHPHNPQRKAAIMEETFQEITRHKIGGTGKTRLSRLPSS